MDEKPSEKLYLHEANWMNETTYPTRARSATGRSGRK